jgi:hypothetical protein
MANRKVCVFVMYTVNGERGAVAAKSDRGVRLFSRHNRDLAHEGPRFVDLAPGKN